MGLGEGPSPYTAVAPPGLLAALSAPFDITGAGHLILPGPISLLPLLGLETE